MELLSISGQLSSSAVDVLLSRGPTKMAWPCLFNLKQGMKYAALVG